MSTKDTTPDLPGENEEENLRMENELIKLKMQAEFGAQSFAAPGMDPALENFFLRNVSEFEKNHRIVPTKVYEMLGRPVFKKASELSDVELSIELDRLVKFLEEKYMAVYFDEVNNRTRYRFITEELFEHESTFKPMPGMTTCYNYEEFHPNHEKDIRQQAEGFIEQWFKQSLDERSWELGNEFILPDRRILAKADVVKQCRNIFDAYKAFVDCHYKIIDIGFQVDDETQMGHAEGMVKYDAMLENGEQARIGGVFKLYMSLDCGWWNIVHIVFPGFNYPQL